MKKLILITSMALFLLTDTYPQMNTISFNRLEKQTKITYVYGVALITTGAITGMIGYIFVGYGILIFNTVNYSQALKGKRDWKINRKIC